MVCSVYSKEFADAWRIVSEALLAYIQSGEFHAMQSENTDDVASSQKPDVAPAEAEDSNVREIRYATCAIVQEDGSYIFRNTKEELQKEVSMYKITRYSDDSCDFELCDLKGEQIDYFKDNPMPSEVGSMKGEITPDGIIITTQKGRGVFEGRMVKITKPLMAESKIE